jgi:hypothetical protein
MSKLRLLVLLVVTATGGCATGTDEPSTPPAAIQLDGDRLQLISGADIPSRSVDVSKTYRGSRHIDEIEHAGLVTADQVELAHVLDGLTGLADGQLDVTELLEAERGIDFSEERANLDALWDALSQF